MRQPFYRVHPRRQAIQTAWFQRRRIRVTRSRWETAAGSGLSIVDGLVYRSNLLGSDRALANIGGGNTSAKETIVDHTGDEVRVLWVKGSGTDLATITALGFGRDAMNRIQNHKEGGIASVYDRHGYAEETKRIMDAVAARLMALVEGAPAGNVLQMPMRGTQ